MAGPIPTYLTTQLAAQGAFTVPFGLLTFVNGAITAATSAGEFNTTADCSLFAAEDISNLRIYLDSLGYTVAFAKDSNQKSLLIDWGRFLDIPGTEVVVDQGSAPWIVAGTIIANQGTSPWVTSVSNFPATVAVTQSTSPWTISGTITANAGTGNFTVAQSIGTNLHAVIDSGTVTLSGTSPVSGTVTANQGTPTSVANSWPVKVTDGAQVLGTTSHPLRIDPTGATTQPVSGAITSDQGSPNNVANSWTVKVTDGSQVLGTTAHPIRIDPTGTTTQPISGNVSTNLASELAQNSTTSGQTGFLEMGAVTTAAPTYASGRTQPLSITTSGGLRVDGSGVTQPISATSLPLPAGAATSSNQTNASQKTQIVDGSGNVIASTTNALNVDVINFPVASLVLGVTATGASGAAVTLTLPAVAGQFHYVSHVEITAYTAVARVGVATPVLVTSTNLPGNPVWDFSTAAAIGTTDRLLMDFGLPVHSSAVNTATTIVCPATTSVIWRMQVFYYTGV